MGRVEIADVCVIGVYNSAQATEFPRAYIVLQKDVQESEQLKNDLLKYVEQSVAPHKKLKAGIRFVPSIPKSPSGKILRRIIKSEWIKAEEEEEVKKSQVRARL